jgi:uncharacterized membrane protein
MERRNEPTSPGPLPVVAGALEILFYLAYPFLIYTAHTRWPTRGVAGALLLLYGLSFALRARGAADDWWPLVRQHLALFAVIVLAVALDDRTVLLLLPMIVSLYLLGTFAASLRRGPPMIERFARMVEDDLPPFTHPYCRRMTVLWCFFLAANAVAVAVLAFAAPLAWWAIYTGLVFYLLLGAFIGAEFLFRKWWFRYYGDGPVDRLFARLLPPERTPEGRRSLAYVQARRAAADPSR